MSVHIGRYLYYLFVLPMWQMRMARSIIVRRNNHWDARVMPMIARDMGTLDFDFGGLSFAFILG